MASIRPSSSDNGVQAPSPKRRCGIALLVAILLVCSALGFVGFHYYTTDRQHGRTCGPAPNGFSLIYCGSSLVAARSILRPSIFAVLAADHIPGETFIVQSLIDLTRRVSISDYVERIVDLLKHYKRRSILLLGLGGGALPLLATTRIRDCQVTAIDISPDSLHIVREFVLPDDGVNVRYIQGSADEMLKLQPSDNYDVVIEDMYFDVSVPDFIYDRDYLQDIHRVLKSDGMFLSNVFVVKGSEDRVQRSVEAIRPVFDDLGATAMSPNGNAILVASKIDRNLTALAGQRSAMRNLPRMSMTTTSIADAEAVRESESKSEL